MDGWVRKMGRRSSEQLESEEDWVGGSVGEKNVGDTV